MRFPSKKNRDSTPRASGVEFEDYTWDNPLQLGWRRVVVLDCKEKETKKGGQMLELILGVENPNGSWGRIRHHVPDAYPPKVQNFMEVLLPEQLEAEEDFDMPEDQLAKALRFRVCGALIVESKQQRNDGSFWREIQKLQTVADCETDMGPEWHAQPGPSEAQPGAAAASETEALF